MEKTEKKQEHHQSLAIPGLSGFKNQSIVIPKSEDHVGPYKIIECENSTIDLQQRT